MPAFSNFRRRGVGERDFRLQGLTSEETTSPTTIKILESSVTVTPSIKLLKSSVAVLSQMKLTSVLVNGSC